MSYNPAHVRSTLMSALLEARRNYGGTRTILTDGDERTFTYDTLVRGAYALGHALVRQSAK